MAKGKTKNIRPVSVVKMKPLTIRLNKKMLRTSAGKPQSVNANPGNSTNSPLGGAGNHHCISKVLVKMEPK
jgi:hypothetical protein